MRTFSTLLVMVLILCSSSVLAADIDGRFGLYGKAGVLVPLKDNFISNTSESDTEVAVGWGLMYGIGKNIAAEMDVTHTTGLDVNISGSRVFDASLTDFSLGLQYRFTPDSDVVPYMGAGVDFIKGDLTSVSGTKYDLDWTYGGHVNIGVDYFFTRGIAFLADFKGIFASSGDVMKGATHVGKYNPLSFVGSVGFRLFWPETAFK